jgi:hypothetical protein
LFERGVSTPLKPEVSDFLRYRQRADAREISLSSCMLFTSVFMQNTFKPILRHFRQIDQSCIPEIDKSHLSKICLYSSVFLNLDNSVDNLMTISSAVCRLAAI